MELRARTGTNVVLEDRCVRGSREPGEHVSVLTIRPTGSPCLCTQTPMRTGPHLTHGFEIETLTPL
jgi:hypothetical protein